MAGVLGGGCLVSPGLQSEDHVGRSQRRLRKGRGRGSHCGACPLSAQHDPARPVRRSLVGDYAHSPFPGALQRVSTRGCRLLCAWRRPPWHLGSHVLLSPLLPPAGHRAPHFHVLTPPSSPSVSALSRLLGAAPGARPAALPPVLLLPLPSSPLQAVPYKQPGGASPAGRAAAR